MVLYSSNSIFNSGMQTLVCTTNTVGAMGAGVARQFRNKYPDILDRYRIALSNGKHDVGSPALFKYHNAPWVLLVATKRDWRQGSEVDYIKQSLAKLTEDKLRSFGVTSIGSTIWGCGNGCLDLSIIHEIMYSHFSKFNMPVTFFMKHDDIVKYRGPDADITFEDAGHF